MSKSTNRPRAWPATQHTDPAPTRGDRAVRVATRAAEQPRPSKRAGHTGRQAAAGATCHSNKRTRRSPTDPDAHAADRLDDPTRGDRFEVGQEIEIAFEIGGERTLVGCVLAIKCGASGALTYSVELANARVDPEHTLELIELQSVIHAFEPPDAQFGGGPSSASQQQWCPTDEAHIADYVRRGSIGSPQCTPTIPG